MAIVNVEPVMLKLTVVDGKVKCPECGGDNIIAAQTVECYGSVRVNDEGKIEAHDVNPEWMTSDDFRLWCAECETKFDFDGIDMV
jgi:hypothetical protein